MTQDTRDAILCYGISWAVGLAIVLVLAYYFG